MYCAVLSPLLNTFITIRGKCENTLTVNFKLDTWARFRVTILMIKECFFALKYRLHYLIRQSFFSLIWENIEETLFRKLFSTILFDILIILYDYGKLQEN